jgi:hypothetical protein
MVFFSWSSPKEGSHNQPTTTTTTTTTRNDVDDTNTQNKVSSTITTVAGKEDPERTATAQWTDVATPAAAASTAAGTSVKTNTDTDTVVINLGEFWQEWSRCITFKHQRDQLYRFGKFDDCGNQWRDYMAVWRVKFTNDTTKAQQVVQSTTLYRNKGTSTTLGVIWESKHPPSWD